MEDSKSKYTMITPPIKPQKKVITVQAVVKSVKKITPRVVLMVVMCVVLLGCNSPETPIDVHQKYVRDAQKRDSLFWLEFAEIKKRDSIKIDSIERWCRDDTRRFADSLNRAIKKKYGNVTITTVGQTGGQTGLIINN